MVKALDVFVVEFLKETAGRGGLLLAPFHTVAGVAEGELPHGAGNADVEEAALLVLTVFLDGALVGDDALFKAGQIDNGELETFRRMERDKADTRLLLDVVLFFAIIVQADFIKESLQVLARPFALVEVLHGIEQHSHADLDSFRVFLFLQAFTKVLGEFNFFQ